jgi:UPF0716 family protein affecting phage T7 exclusion
MNKGDQPDKHRQQCDYYLDQTKDAYVVDPASGLYRPKAREAKQETKAKWTDKVTAISALFGISITAVGLLVAVGGLILSIVTVVLLFYTAKIYSRQLGEMQRANTATETAVGIASGTLEETKRSDRIQQRNNLIQQQQNQKALETTQQENEKALQATIDDFRLDQRAWIGFQTIDVERNPSPVVHDNDTGRPITKLDMKGIHLVIVNTGKTPATIDRFEGATYSWHQNPDFKGPDLSNKVGSTLGMFVPVPPGLMIPGQTAKAEAGGGTMTGTMMSVPFEMTKIEVDYRDAWNKPHTTKLCIYVTYWQINHFDYCPMPGSNSMS